MLMLSTTCATCILVLCAVLCHMAPTLTFETSYGLFLVLARVELAEVVIYPSGDEVVHCFGVIEGHKSVSDSLVSSLSLQVLDPLHLGDRVGWDATSYFHVP